MPVANVCYHMSIPVGGSKWENMVAFATIATTNFESCRWHKYIVGITSIHVGWIIMIALFRH